MNTIAGRLEKETRFYSVIEKKLEGFPSVFKEYYTSMRANRKSYTTIGVYINNALHFANFITNKKITNDFYKNITTSDVESYMISLETRETKSGIKRTGDDILQARWSSLNAFFGWLVKRGYIENNPIVEVSRPKNNVEHKITFLSKTEINKLFRAISKNDNHVISARDKAVVSLALATALRVSALVNINIEELDLNNNFPNCV